MVAEKRIYNIYPGNASYALVRFEGEEQCHDIRIRYPDKKTPMILKDLLDSKIVDEKISKYREKLILDQNDNQNDILQKDENRITADL
jgi:hypothetical protein